MKSLICRPDESSSSSIHCLSETVGKYQKNMVNPKNTKKPGAAPVQVYIDLASFPSGVPGLGHYSKYGMQPESGQSTVVTPLDSHTGI